MILTRALSHRLLYISLVFASASIKSHAKYTRRYIAYIGPIQQEYHLISLFLTRHGERADFASTSWAQSAERPNDPPITNRGKEQAKAMGQFLSNNARDLRSVYVSPFFRAVQTASITTSHINPPSVNYDSVIKGSVRLKREYGIGEELRSGWFPNGDPMVQLRSLPELVSHGFAMDTSYKSHHLSPSFPESSDGSDFAKRVGSTLRQLVCAHIAEGLLWGPWLAPESSTTPTIGPTGPAPLPQTRSILVVGHDGTSLMAPGSFQSVLGASGAGGMPREEKEDIDYCALTELHFHMSRQAMESARDLLLSGSGGVAGGSSSDGWDKQAALSKLEMALFHPADQHRDGAIYGGGRKLRGDRGEGTAVTASKLVSCRLAKYGYNAYLPPHLR